MKIKTLLIDDEALARTLVQNFIKVDPDFEVVGEAGDGFEAMKKITELQPDLIFLDIQMPKLTGLELLELLPNPPIVVFSTAYDQYAIEAFEKNAVDYLLKPFSRDRFQKALQKVKEKIEAKVDTKGRNQESAGYPAASRQSLGQNRDKRRGKDRNGALSGYYSPRNLRRLCVDLYRKSQVFKTKNHEGV